MLRYLTFGVHGKSSSKKKDKQKGEIVQIRLADVLTGLKLNMEQVIVYKLSFNILECTVNTCMVFVISKHDCIGLVRNYS